MTSNKTTLRLASCCTFALVILAAAIRAEEPGRPELTKLPFAFAKGMENTPLQYKGRLLLLMNRRDDTKSEKDGYRNSMYGYFIDLRTGEEFGRFAAGHSFVNGYVEGDRLHVFASQGTDRDWFQSIDHFWTDDLKTWQQEEAIHKAPDEHLFNSSVCRDDQGYLMAYESNRPVQFCFRFARSPDLRHWTTVPNLCYRGERNEYSACPAIRYFKPYYYVLYLHAATKNHPSWVTYIARSKDLATWEISPLNPVLEAGPSEGINNSDVDVIEIDRKTYLTYATGDQATWSAVRMAMYAGPLQDFLAAWFPPSPPGSAADARFK